MNESSRIIPFQLFRLVLESKKKNHRSFGELNISKSEMIKKMLYCAPSIIISPTKQYVASKVKRTPTGDGLYFQFGEKRLKKATDFNESEKEFFQTYRNETDCVHCLYDVGDQLLAIEKKNNLPNPRTLAKHIASAINDIKNHADYRNIFTPNEIMLLSNTECKAHIVFESNRFIDILKNAYKIIKYKITMLPPNPADFGDILKNPLERLMDDTGAKIATLQISNKEDGLDSNRLVPLTRDIATYGVGAEAKVIKEEGGTEESIKLNEKNNEAFLSIHLPQSLLSKDFSLEMNSFIKRLKEKMKELHGK